MTKLGPGHGMVRSQQNYASPFNILAMAEVAIKTANTSVKNKVYIQEL